MILNLTTIVKNIIGYPFRFCLLLFFFLCTANLHAITLRVGETYTCNIGYVSHLQSTVWTNSAPGYLEFTTTVSAYSTSVTVKAKKAFSSPIVVQCKYYWLERDPVTGRYIYSRNSAKDWTFFIEEDDPERVSLSPTNITMDIGERYNIIAEVLPSTANQALTWSCYPSGVVSVNDGHVYAMASGEATVTATAVNGVSANCYVTVRSVEPQSVSLTSPSPVKIGQTVKLTPNIYPSNAQTSFTWRSSNTSVATINSSGEVTGKYEGTTRITVTTSNNLTASCDVEVYKPVPSNITLNKSSLKLPLYGVETLKPSVTPSDAIYTVSWQSSAPDVVTVNSNGRVEAKSTGTAKITATTDNGKQAVCVVTVPQEPSKVTIIPEDVELIVGRSKKLSYSFVPSDAATAEFTWSSSDANVASVSQSGEVKAVRPGRAIISATTRNGIVGKCTVFVPEPLYQLFVWTKKGIKTGYLSTDEPQFELEGDIVNFKTKNLTLNIHIDTLDKFTLEQVLPEHPKSVSLPESMLLGLGSTQRLTYSLTPAPSETTVKWFCDDPSVVSITPDGSVTALKVGEAYVVVQTDNGLRAGCTVTVPEPRLRFYVWLRDGTIHGYDLEERPVVTLGEELFTLVSSETTVEYNAADVLRFTLQDAAINDPVTAIEQPKEDENVSYKSGIFTLQGGAPYAPVYVYNISGRLIDTFEADEAGTLAFSIDAYDAGIYIIKTEKTTIKINKR